MWAKVFPFAPHIIHNVLSSSPCMWRCLLRVLCPVGRPVTALDWVLLKDRNLTLAPTLGAGIGSRASLWVSPRTSRFVQCWLMNQRLRIFFYISSRVSQGRLKSKEPPKIKPPLARSSAISLPRTPECSGTQNIPTSCRLELLFNAFWHFCTKSRRSDGMKSFQGHLTITAGVHVFLWSILQFNFVTTAQDSTYLVWTIVAYLSREIWAFFLPIAHRLQPRPLHVLGPFREPDEPFDCSRSASLFGPIFPCQYSNPIFGFRIKY